MTRPPHEHADAVLEHQVDAVLEHPVDEPDAGYEHQVDEPEVDEPEVAERQAGEDASDGGGRGPSQSTLLVRLARSAYELHVSPDGEAYALPVDGPRVARQLRGQRGSLRGDLAAAYFDRHAAAVSSSALADALAVVEGLAVRTTPAVPLHLRCAEHDDGAVWLDLGRVDGTAVRIADGTWHLTGGPGPAGTSACPGPVWRRTLLTGELPIPVRGGRLDELWAGLNVAAAHRPLVTAWLVAALIPSIPAPILGVTGEQGTGKSSATRTLVQLVDPSPVPLRTGPKDVTDWIVAAAGSRVVGLDNVSGMPGWLSDALCRAVTGDGMVRRSLFTDGDLAVQYLRRVVVLNGIDLGIGRGDLADRMIVAELDRIDDDHRRLDADVAEQWTRTHPAVLGALLDLTAAVLAALPAVQLGRYPRMADYARVLAAVDQLTGTTGLDTYLAQRDQLSADLIAGDPLAAAVLAHVEALPYGAWTGTAADLLDILTPARPHSDKIWPASPRGMTAALTRLAPALRASGIDVELGHRQPGGKRRRIVTLRPRPEGAGNNRPDRPDRPGEPLSSTNTRDDPRDGRDDPLWPALATVPDRPEPSRTSQPPDQAKHHGRDGRDGRDGRFPSPLVQPAAATCIACRHPLSWDDGTHTHPTCGGAA